GVADLHHQRDPTGERGDPGMPRQRAEVEGAKGGLRDHLPDGLAVPPLSPHGLEETGGEIDHAKVRLHHPQATDGDRLLSAGGARAPPALSTPRPPGRTRHDTTDTPR